MNLNKKAINLMSITIFVIVLFLHNGVLYSNQLDFLTIGCGKDVESYVKSNYNMPNAQIVNIFTTPLIQISDGSGYYEYEFRLYGDTIAAAKWWFATYYDATLDTLLSLTVYGDKDSDYYTIFKWNKPFIKGWTKDCYFKEVPIAVTSATHKQFKAFITILKDKQEFIDAYNNGYYVVGAGVPDSIVINGELLSFEEDKPMYYFIAIDSITNTATNMCYQYFDSESVNCVYASIVEISFSDLKLYPNPTSNYLDVSLADVYSKITAEVLDLEGKSLFKMDFENEKDFQIKFPFSLPDGTYTLSLTIDGKQTATNFIIAK